MISVAKVPPGRWSRPVSLKHGESEIELPANNQMIKSTCWFGLNVLLEERDHMDQIAAAFRKVKQHAGEIAKA